MLVILLVAATGLTLAVVLTGLSVTTRIPLGNKTFVRVRTPSFWKALSGAPCALDYRSALGRGESVGTITLWRDLVNMPTLLIADGNDGSFFCLYQFDMDWRLLRIDPRRRFVSFPSDNWSCLSNEVCSTPWEIKEADLSEWQRSLATVVRMSSSEFKRQRIPIYTLAGLRLGDSRNTVQTVMEIRIHRMVAAGTTQWPIITSRRHSKAAD